MLETEIFEDEVRDLILDICSVMHRHGYEEVSVGALMRLMGVDSERAENHDDQIFLLDESFQAILEARDSKCGHSISKNKTLH